MRRIRDVFTQMVFNKLFGEMRTLLPTGPVVTYVDTLFWLSVAKHTSHPIASSGLKGTSGKLPSRFT
jgi:hypothetical protein